MDSKEDLKTAQQIDTPFTDDEIRLFNVYDVAVGLIIDIQNGKTFTLAEIKNQLIEIVEIIQEEL